MNTPGLVEDSSVAEIGEQCAQRHLHLIRTVQGCTLQMKLKVEPWAEMQTKPTRAQTHLMHKRINPPSQNTNKITNSAFFQVAVCHAQELDAQEAFAVSKGLNVQEAFGAEQRDAEHLDACSHAADAAERATDVKDEVRHEPADQHAFGRPPAKAAKAGESEAIESLSMYVFCFLPLSVVFFVSLLTHLHM